MLVGLLAAIAAAAVAVVLLVGGDDDGPRRPRGDEPLAYVAPNADVILDLDTGAPLVGLALAELVPRVTGGALTAETARALIGGAAALALTGERVQLALVATDPDALARLTKSLSSAGTYRGARLFRRSDAALAVRDETLLVGADVAALRRALDRRARPDAAGARRRFDRRFTGLPGASAVRVAFAAGPLLRRVQPQLAATVWGRSLRDGAAVLSSDGDGIRIPFRVRADPTGVRAQDLPIAPGARVPQAHATAPLVVGLRSLTQSLGFARQAGLDPLDLDLLDALPGFLRPDVGGLTGDAAITSSDLTHLTARTQPRDAGDWSAKLGRLDALSTLLGGTGLTDIDIDQRDGVYSVTQSGQLQARVGVFGPSLVLSNDPAANLRAAAAAPPAPAVPGAAGALTARLAAGVVRQLVADRFPLPSFAQQALGDATAWARAETNGVNGELRLALQLGGLGGLDPTS